jgi:hypothetical protein
MFTQLELMDITYEVEDQIRIPLVPNSVQQVLILGAVDQVCGLLETALDDTTQRQLQSAVHAGSQGVTPELIKHVGNQIVDRVDSVPLLSRETKFKLVMVILKIVLGDETMLDVTCKKLSSSAIDSTRVLLNEGERAKLVHQLVQKYPVVGLSESQEEALFAKAVDGIAHILGTLVPPAMQNALNGATLADIAMLKVCEG